MDRRIVIPILVGIVFLASLHLLLSTAYGDTATEVDATKKAERATGLGGLKDRWDAARSWAMLKLKRGDGGGVSTKERKASTPVERAMSFSDSNKSRWDTIRSWAKIKLMGGSRQPVTEKAEEKVGGQGVGEKMKDAISKSVETSKETVEHAAKSAADAVDEVVNKAKETVKKGMPSKSKVNVDDEL